MKTIRKQIAILLTAFCLFSFVACGEKKDVSSNNSALAKENVKVVDNMVIITVDSDYFKLDENTVLVDYMTALKNDGALEFTLSQDGMVNSINGQENPADWTKCWMLYSNDVELSNEAWGTVSVDGVTYFSAVLGAESLPIKDGKIYVWEFKSF